MPKEHPSALHSNGAVVQGEGLRVLEPFGPRRAVEYPSDDPGRDRHPRSQRLLRWGRLSPFHPWPANWMRSLADRGIWLSNPEFRKGLVGNPLTLASEAVQPSPR